MAALMNNTTGDGNGYVGNTRLKPEVASTYSLTANWGDTTRKRWTLEVSGYYTFVSDYIDAQRCDMGQCSAANQAASSAFVLLQYVNQSALITGFDASAYLVLFQSGPLGAFSAKATLSALRAKNLATQDNLYGIMPVHGRFALRHELGSLTSAVEFVAVGDKRRVSTTRNEMATPGYLLVHLRGGYEWKHARVDLAIENLLNRLYYSPLGGAYLGQGASMTTSGIAWSTTVPGPGRSVIASASVFF
jgi:iron complex outermembrane receptor protein